MRSTIEPGLIRAFRYFALIALFYYAAIVGFTMLQTGQGLLSVQPQWYLNFLSNGFLFVYLSIPALQKKLGKYFLPLAFTLTAGVPMFTNLIRVFPHAGSFPWDVDPTWVTFPHLLVTVVFIAWQYSFRSVVVFTICAAIVEEAAVFTLIGQVNLDSLPILGLPLLRAFSFGLTGHIVSRLMNNQRAQRRELTRANIQLSQHAATLEQLTLSQERNRMARELHDILAHTLSGQAVSLEAIKVSLSPEQDEIVEMLDQALKTTRDGLHEVRRAIQDLRSKSVEELGLGTALERLVSEAAARASLSAEIEIAKQLPVISVAVEHTIYRVAQEAIANVVRHADASNISLRLGVQADRLCLSISDDGVGFDADTAGLEDRHGISGMLERANSVGGDLTVVSKTGEGTRIELSVEVLRDQRIDL